MASFIVTVQQPLPVLRFLLYRQCTADLMTGKCRIAYYSQWIESHRRCCVVFSLSKHGPRLPFSLDKFFDWTHTLAAAMTIRVLTIQSA
jgi:hypothetical protein